MKKYFLATLGTIIFIPVITIGAELHKPLKDLLKNIFWHHWLGKSILVIAVFALLLIIFSRTKDTEKENQLTAIISLTFLSTLVVFAFFTFEYFTHLS